MTPLDWAIKSSNPNIIQMLQEHEAENEYGE